MAAMSRTQAKATFRWPQLKTLLDERGVTLEVEQADILNWDWPEAEYDLVAAIFIQFAPPHERERIIATARRMNALGINRGKSGNVSALSSPVTHGNPNPSVTKLLNDIRTDVETGTSLSLDKAQRDRVLESIRQ